MLLLRSNRDEQRYVIVDCVRPSVRTNVRQKKIHREETSEPRNTNVCTYSHVDKKSSLANLRLDSQRYRP